MSSLSNEAIIALISLLATCIPIGLILWRIFSNHRSKQRTRRKMQRDLELGLIDSMLPHWTGPRCEATTPTHRHWFGAAQGGPASS
ncbi:hypothetical protein IQ07DRAFT_148753 [Pyrenochaeta sp. DS3sAY3a]|nr:hypothetical protein IQ07DRAFT_148753 [Pyrenochaeta sp. DS3sAY3a]